MRGRTRAFTLLFPLLALALLAPSPASHAAAPAPLVWFAPLDQLYRDYAGYGGSVDFMDLFQARAPWVRAAGQVGVFKLYGDPIFRFDDAQLAAVFGDLRRRGIALALEFGPLTPSGCGDGVEGFIGHLLAQSARRIRSLGGELRYLAMDEPFYYGSLYDGPRACRWSAQQIAENAAVNLGQLRAEFPEVLVGDIEPVLALSGAAPPEWLDRYAEWIDAFAAATGRPLAFIHADVAWSFLGRQSGVVALGAVAADKGVPYGVIYNAGFEEADRDWLRHAEEHFVDFELHGGRPPEHAVFQSWTPRPTHVLPETSPEAFTFVIDQYVRERTRLTLKLRRPPAASTLLRSRAVGRLTDASGRGLTSVPLTLSVAQPSGVHVVTGTVPSTARSALVGLRINSECGDCGGPADVLLRSFRYTEATAPARTVDLDFGDGLAGWAPWGSGQFLIEPIDSPPYQALHVLVQPSEFAALNSGSFPVTPGALFTYEVSATIPPESAGSGYLAIFFLSAAGIEVWRERAPIEPARVAVAQIRTGRGGLYSCSLRETPDAVALTAAYGGSSQYWPSDSTLDLRSAAPP
jgi:hypothetical protein